MFLFFPDSSKWKMTRLFGSIVTDIGAGCVWFDHRAGQIDNHGHDQRFCTKAITVTDNFKNALGDTSQFS